MSRRIIQVCAVLLGGPLLAFGLVFAGCDGAAPVLGEKCGHNIIGTVVIVTLACWFVLAICVSLANGLRGNE